MPCSMHMVRSSPQPPFANEEGYADFNVALVTGQLCNEILEVISEVSKLFGVLNEDALKLQ